MIDRSIDDIRIKAIRLIEQLNFDNELPGWMEGRISHQDILSAGLNWNNPLQREIIMQCITDRVVGYIVGEYNFARYKDLLIQKNYEHNSSYNASFDYFRLISYRARRIAYPRHLRSIEAFGIIFDGIEGRLSDNMKNVYDEMIDNLGEWLNLAFKLEGSSLIAYVDPGFLIDEDIANRATEKFEYSEKRTFDMKGLINKKVASIKLFDDEFVKFIYGRKFIDFPEELKSKSMTITLPEDSMIWPVSRKRFNIDASHKFGSPMFFSDHIGITGGLCTRAALQIIKKI